MSILRSLFSNSSDCRRATFEQLVHTIADSAQASQTAIDCLCQKLHPQIGHMRRKHQLPEEELIDKFADSILVLVADIRAGKKISNLKGYFYRIFDFKCIDLIRKRSTNRKEATVELPPEMAAATEEDRPIQSVDRDEQNRLRKVIRSCIESLNTNQRLVLQYQWDGLSMEKIAEKTDYANGKVVKQTASNSRRQLGRCLKERGIEMSQLEAAFPDHLMEFYQLLRPESN